MIADGAANYDVRTPGFEDTGEGYVATTRPGLSARPVALDASRHRPRSRL